MIVGQKTTKTAAGAGVIQAIGPNPQRVGIIVGQPSTSKIFIALGEIPANDDGIAIQGAAQTPFVLRFDSPNDYITQPINVYCQGALTFSIVELIDRRP